MTAGLRWNADDGEWELRCETCPPSHCRYWPLTMEFWDPARGMRRCRACCRTTKRTLARDQRAKDPTKSLEAVRRYRGDNREAVNFKKRVAWESMTPEQRVRVRETQRAWVQAHPENIAAIRKRHRDRNIEEYRRKEREYMRAWRARKRSARAA